MFGKRGKKGLLEQVEDAAGDLADRLAPHVESARDQLGPILADARDKAAPYVADARDKAGPYVSDARDKAAPYVADARERIKSDVVPAVSAAVSDARDKAAPYVEEARKESRRRGKATAAALRGEVDAPKKKGGKFKKVLLAGGLIGLGAFVFKKLKGEDDSAWQSSYAPPAPPSPAPSPAGNKPPAPAGTRTPPAPAPGADDTAGASPDEAISDTAAEGGAHQVTTPDEPAETVDVNDDEQPKP